MNRRKNKSSDDSNTSSSQSCWGRCKRNDHKCTVFCKSPKGCRCRGPESKISSTVASSVTGSRPVSNIGPTGPAGPTGPIGSAGPTGSVGPTGSAGPTGSVGSAGPTGSVGPTGSTGSAGPTGPTGSAGPTNTLSSATPNTCIAIKTNPTIPDVSLLYMSSGPVLATYDVATNTQTIIGNMPAGEMFDIAMSPTGVLYGVDLFGTNLYIIDTTTAATTLVAPIVPTINPNSLTFGADGTLYANSYPSNLYTINPTTGAATLLFASLPEGPIGTGDLGFLGDKLFFATGQGLYRIILEDLPNSYNVGAWNPPASTFMGIMGLAELYFDNKARLYGSDYMTIFEIDPESGNRFNIISVPDFSGGQIQGMTSFTWAQTPELMCFQGDLNMSFNNVKSVGSLEVDNISTTSQFPTGTVNVHNNLKLFSTPSKGGRLIFESGKIQIGDNTTTANVPNGIAIGNGATTNNVPGSICLGPNAGAVNLDPDHPLAVVVNSSGVDSTVLAQTHTLGIVINGTKYKILLSNL